MGMDMDICTLLYTDTVTSLLMSVLCQIHKFQICIFWNVMLCCWCGGYWHFKEK